MDVKRLLVSFVSIFLLVLVVAAVVTYLWSLVFHGAGVVDWDTAFPLAIILGIVLTWVEARERTGEGKEG